MQYYLETYGCQMNVADSELVAGLLERSGCRRTVRIEDARIVLINTCSIREKAAETVLHRLDRLAGWKRDDPSRLIALLGCMARNLTETISETRPHVDIILGPDSYRRLPEIIRERSGELDHVVDTRLSRMEVYEDLFPSRVEGVNAWVSIMRGCDKFCSFCVVPFTRGRERSRSLESIVAEVEEAVLNGYVEVTLLGQNVNSYRHPDPVSGEIRFPELLAAVAMVPGLRRIRFTSPHPQDVDERLLKVMAEHENICKSIHLPLQAGADRVLRRMNRSYTRGEFLQLAGRIRQAMPVCTITTDLIVGFPGEAEEEFQETLEMVDRVRFDSAFTFKYSPRPGTRAAEFPGQVPEAVKQDRLERLIARQKAITLEKNREWIGRVVEVLVEKESKKSAEQWAGRTDGNKWVVFDKGAARVKDFVTIHIDAAHGVVLKGRFVEQVEANHAVA